MEFDRDKLPASIDVAEKAIHQRLRGLPIAHSKEHRQTERCTQQSRGSQENALAHLACVEAFSIGLKSNYCGIGSDSERTVAFLTNHPSVAVPMPSAQVNNRA